MRRARAGAFLAVAGALFAAPAALGDATITAGPLPNTYSTTSVTIDQGQSITFQNTDQTAFHDVTADQKGPDGKPLFASDTIQGGKTSPVRGVEFLTTGDYGYHCSVHTFMTGTIHVTANGTPKPHTPDNPAPSPSDKTPPDASVSILDSRIAAVLKRGALRVRLTTNEPTRFNLTALSGKTRVATGIVVVKGNAENAKLGLTKQGKQLLRKAKSVTVRLTAKVNDAADNRATAAATRTLR